MSRRIRKGGFMRENGCVTERQSTLYRLKTFNLFAFTAGDKPLPYGVK